MRRVQNVPIMMVEMTSRGEKVTNIARGVWRFQDRICFKHRHQARRMRHWFYKVAHTLWSLFIGISLLYTLVAGAEKFIHLPAEQQRPFRFLVPLATWLTSLISSDRLDTWLIQIFTWLFSQWVVWLLAGVVIALPAGWLVLAWSIPRLHANYRQSSAEERSRLLREATRQVPTRGDVVSRFVVVFVVTWLGLRFFSRVASWLGYCLLPLDDLCTTTYVTEFMWLTFAAIGALASLWDIHHARAQRTAARRALIKFQGSPLRRLRDTIKLVLSGILFMASLGVVFMLIVAGFDLF